MSGTPSGVRYLDERVAAPVSASSRALEGAACTVPRHTFCDAYTLPAVRRELSVSYRTSGEDACMTSRR